MDLKRLLPNTFTSIMTDLSPSQLWPFVSDPMILPRFSTELQAVRLSDVGPLRVGSTFEGDQKRGEREWTTISTVTALEPLRLFEWTVGVVDDPVSRWSLLIDENSGGTTLTHRVVLCGGPSPLTDSIMDQPEMAEEIIQTRLETIRDRMGITIEAVVALAREQS